MRDQFLRFETETEQVQSQQARPRPILKRYSLNKRDRDSYSRIFKTETETRKMCIFETETRKMVETKSLADLWFVPDELKRQMQVEKQMAPALKN